MKKILSTLKIINKILLIVAIILFILSLYIKLFFNDVSFEQILYAIIEFKGASISVIIRGLLIVTLLFLILYLLKKLFSIILFKIPYKVSVTMSFGNKKHTVDFKRVFEFIFIIIFVSSSYLMLNVGDYIKMAKSSTDLYEKYYVNAKNTNIIFPKSKRNLIYIYLESMEMTNASKSNGGFVSESYIPGLEKLALENINFSNKSNLGGEISIYGTTYTSASLVAHTSGVPLKVSIGWKNYKNYGKSIPGVYNLGDILKDNGYKNYFMIGSDADYGGRKDYFKHGDYEILDYYWAIKEGLIDKNYYIWWGYEDLKLFEYAKNKLSEISKNDEPFNFTLLTVDTHFSDGYQDATCTKKFRSKYANSLYCSDSKVYEFIEWIKKQDFYDNTTIVITGDHLSFQGFFYADDDTYTRTVYNSIINSPIEAKNEKNRMFTSFDMFPTTLASLGVNIEGNRLGLGVNLFSDEETLLEKFGIYKFEKELKAKSFYYDNYLLKDHYYKMQKDVQKERKGNNEKN